MNESIGEQMAARGLRCSGARLWFAGFNIAIRTGAEGGFYLGFVSLLSFEYVFPYSFCRPLVVSIHILRGRFPARIYTLLFR